MLTRRRKWKVCRQHDSMECGAACLQMICRHYGKSFSLQTLSERCHVTNSGVSMLDITTVPLKWTNRSLKSPK